MTRPPPEDSFPHPSLNALPVAVIETDEDGTIRTWSGAAERLFGWAAADALGKSIESLELVHEADLQFVDTVVDRLRRGHERHLVHRNRTRSRSGEVRHCEWTRVLLLAPRGERPSILSYVLDVSAQAEAETALLAARAEMDGWLHANPEGFCGLDRDWRITHWNASAERMLERSRLEVVGRELWTLFPELRGTVFHQAFDEALADGYSRTLEARSPCSRSWYAVTAVPSSRGLSVFFADVTGRRQLEEELLSALIKDAGR